MNKNFCRKDTFIYFSALFGTSHVFFILSIIKQRRKKIHLITMKWTEKNPFHRYQVNKEKTQLIVCQYSKDEAGRPLMP